MKDSDQDMERWDCGASAKCRQYNEMIIIIWIEE